MSLTDSDRIIELGGQAGVPIMLDSDGNLVSPTEIWVYTTTSDVDEEIHATALTSDDSAEMNMNKIAATNKWIAAFNRNPNLIDTAGVWTEITE